MPTKRHRFRFYADECIPIPTVAFLREKGLVVRHAADIDMIGKSDSYQMKVSKQLNMVLLTLDHDFKKIDSFSLTGHPGIILVQVTSFTKENINQVLDKALKNINEGYIKNSKVTVSIDQIVKEKNGVVTKREI